MPMIPQAGLPMMGPGGPPMPGPGGDIGPLLAALAGGPPAGPTPGPGPAGPPDQQGGDPEGALRQGIQDLHALETLLPDPQDVENVKQCGYILAKIQTKMHMAKQQAGNAGQALVQRIGGPGY